MATAEAMTVAETLVKAIAAREYLQGKLNDARELYRTANNEKEWRFSYNRGMEWGLRLAITELDSLITRLRS